MRNDINANTVLSTTLKDSTWIIVHAPWIIYTIPQTTPDTYIQTDSCLQITGMQLVASPSMDKTTKIYKTAWDLKIFYKSNALTLISRKQEMQQTDKIARRLF